MAYTVDLLKSVGAESLNPDSNEPVIAPILSAIDQQIHQTQFEIHNTINKDPRKFSTQSERTDSISSRLTDASNRIDNVQSRLNGENGLVSQLVQNLTTHSDLKAKTLRADKLASVLQLISQGHSAVLNISNLITSNNLFTAAELWESSQSIINNLKSELGHMDIAKHIITNFQNLQDDLIDLLGSAFQSSILIQNSSLNVPPTVTISSDFTMTCSQITESLSKLTSLDSYLESLCRRLSDHIVIPLLSSLTETTKPLYISSTANPDMLVSLELKEQESNLQDTQKETKIIDSLQLLLESISKIPPLPSNFYQLFQQSLFKNLIDLYLETLLPTSLENVEHYMPTLERGVELEKNYSCLSSFTINNWSNSFSFNWSNKRIQSEFNTLRSVINKWDSWNSLSVPAPPSVKTAPESLIKQLQQQQHVQQPLKQHQSQEGLDKKNVIVQDGWTFEEDQPTQETKDQDQNSLLPNATEPKEVNQEKIDNKEQDDGWDFDDEPILQEQQESGKTIENQQSKKEQDDVKDRDGDEAEAEAEGWMFDDDGINNESDKENDSDTQVKNNLLNNQAEKKETNRKDNDEEEGWSFDEDDIINDDEQHNSKTDKDSKNEEDAPDGWDFDETQDLSSVDENFNNVKSNDNGMQVDDENEEEDGWNFDESIVEEENKPQKSVSNQNEIDHNNIEKNSLQEQEPEPEPEQAGQQDLESWDWDNDDNNDEEQVVISSTSSSKRKLHHERRASRKKSPPTQNEGIPVDMFMVSTKSQSLIDQSISLLDESLKLKDPKLTVPQLSSAYESIFQAGIDILFFFQAVMPTQHSRLIESVPTLGMQFANDCVWLSHEFASKVKNIVQDYQQNALATNLNAELKIIDDLINSLFQLGEFWRQKLETIQLTSLFEMLDDANGFRNTSDQLAFDKCERSLNQVLISIEQLAHSWKPVLVKDHFNSIMGSIIEKILSRLLHEIENQHDISEDESKQLNILCKKLHSVEDIFKENDESSIGMHVPSWFKFVYLSELLEASMADIMFLHSEGHLIDFQPTELANLVRALFADSERRAQNIKKILG